MFLAVTLDDWMWAPIIVGAIFILTMFAAFIRWQSKVDTDRGNFREFMTEVRADIKEILRRMPPVPVAGSSPLRLTEFGEELSAWINAHAWAASVAPTVPLAGGEKPFQLDAVAERYTKENLDGHMDQQMAECAFEFGINKEGVRDVLRVVLRDALLERTGQSLPD